jgi:hypothetical protein
VLLAADVIAALRAANGLALAVGELRVTLNGAPLTNEEIVDLIDEAILQVELNRDND